jgi:lysozyme
MASQLKGLDVSQFNNVNLQQARDEGYGFVLVRAGYGGGGKDVRFANYWQEALEARDAEGVPLVRLAYHFAYPGRSSGEQQAHDFLSIVGTLQPGDGLMLDMEDERAYGRDIVESDVAWAKEFLDTCAELTSGVKPLLYINSNLKSRFDWSPVQKANYGLHIANYGPNDGQKRSEPAPAPWEFWAMWQYTSKGTVAGASPIDLDVFNGDHEHLLQYGAAGVVTPKPQPTPQPAPAAPTAPSSYTVQRGDSLSSIAPKFNTTWQALASLNGLPNPNLIFPGQVLRVPSSGIQRTYVVKKGDNLTAIAKSLSTTVASLVSLNGIANPNLIFPGQTLKY